LHYFSGFNNTLMSCPGSLSVFADQPESIIMKIISISFLLLLLCAGAFAQDASIRKLQVESARTVNKDIVDTSHHHWSAGGTYQVSAGQGSLSNWAAGGDDFSFSASTSLHLFSFFKKEKASWDNSLNFNFGYIKTSSLGSRKNDDRIDFISRYGYALNKKLNLTTLTNFRSQLLNGYSYSETSKGSFRKNFASAFLSPAYVLISQGLDFKPGKNLSVFVSPVTARWVIVRDDSLAARGDYGVTPGKHHANQLGAFATIHYTRAFNKFISYTGRIDLFSNYKNNPLNTDLYMTNAVSAKIGKLICFSWNLDMIYDDDVKLFGKNGTSPALQMKSVVGVGLQVKI